MAYMSQENKAKIAAVLKVVIPADWKWSLAVRDHSTICLTIASAPVDLVASYASRGMEEASRAAAVRKGHVDVNQHHWKDHFNPELVDVFEKVFEALNLDNHDRSDSMTDYFDVGHYVRVSIGRWDKPFVLTPGPRVN
jgi:hypothetical protein